jgi:hypothetical protein
VGTEPLRRIRAGLGQEFPALRAQITKGE